MARSMFSGGASTRSSVTRNHRVVFGVGGGGGVGEDGVRGLAPAHANAINAANTAINAKRFCIFSNENEEKSFIKSKSGRSLVAQSLLLCVFLCHLVAH